MHVLLVDDEKELVSTLAERLEMRGIDAAWAVDYPTARTELQKQKVDVVVLDVRLAEMNGLELKRLIEAEYPGMRYIFLTGHGSEEDFNACSAENGSASYLIKPVQINEFIEKLREIAEK